MKNIIAVFLFFTMLSPVRADNIESLLRKKMPDAKITRIESIDHYTDAFEIMLMQPVDHKNPAAGYFEQQIFVGHTGRKKPVVLNTEGYSARFNSNELARILKANLITVEYRFTGESKPDKIQWQYLTNEQAARDLHRIRKIFKKIYRKEWVSTGISKGGQTTLYYKSWFPRDVCVAVPYVAPMPIAQEDRRTDQHQLSIGTESCRSDILKFQQLALKNRETLIHMIDTFSTNRNITFSVGMDSVLEYAVLEYPFSFWQWGASCELIPDENAKPQEIFNYLNSVVSFDFYSVSTYRFFESAFYQFMTEMGYYGFSTKGLEDLLVAMKHPSNIVFGPENTDLSYHPEAGQKVLDYLEKKGNKIIYIYGEMDTWTACGVKPSPKTNAVRFDKKGGSHSTRIISFSKAEQQQIYDALRKWLKAEVYPLPD